MGTDMSKTHYTRDCTHVCRLLKREGVSLNLCQLLLLPDASSQIGVAVEIHHRHVKGVLTKACPFCTFRTFRLHCHLKAFKPRCYGLSN